MNREGKLEVAIKAAVASGKLLLEYYSDTFGVSVKESLRDIVTEVDKMAQQRIVDILKNDDSAITISAEEQEQPSEGNAGVYWVVDALDGTVNYVNRIPFFAVSIAFIENFRPTIGVIYNPMSEDLYYGALDAGVFKNQKRMKVKDRPPQECLFSVAFSGKSYDVAARKDEFLLFAEVNDHSRGCLRTGSAAMNLAYLAEGRFSGCWGKANKFWDVAAGLLLAELAGAKVKSREVAKEKHLVTYLASVPSAWEFISQKAKIF